MLKLKHFLVHSQPPTMTNVIKESVNKTKCAYSIEAPGVLRSNANYKVAVTLFEVTECCDIKITISGGSFKLEETILVQPFCTETLCFEIPDLDPDEAYFLDVESLTGIELNDSIELLFEKGKPLAYIQFDKQAYKRKDKVDFRVLLLERELLKPFVTKSPIAVCLKFSDKLLFEKIIKLEKGLYTGQWPIPIDASHGSYTMKVFVGDVLITTKNFDIIDYTRPKFKIDIKAPKELIYAQKQFHVDVEAKHFDCTPVEGTCKLEVKSVAGFFSGIYIEKFLPINGNIESTIIDVVDDLDIDSSFTDTEWFSTATIMLKVTVTDKSSLSQVTLNKLITLKRDESVREEDEDEICTTCKPCKDCSNCCEMESEDYYIEEDTNNPIKIVVAKTKELLVGDILDFNIELKKPANYCLYFIIARGNIIKSELIKVEDYTAPIARDLEISFICAPRAFILAYFISDGVLYFDEIGFNLRKNFENKLTLSVPNTVAPNAVITIEIKSAPNSLVGIMAVDSNSVVINATNDFSFEKFFKDLYLVRSQVPEMKASGRYPGLMSGLLTFTDAKIDGLEEDESEDGRYSYFPDREHFQNDDWMPRIDIERKKKKIIREMQEQSQVFGNWLFLNKETDCNGQLKIDVTLPEKPAIWLLTAFAINSEKGFVMTREPIKISTEVDNVSKDTFPQTTNRITKSQVTKFVFDHYDNNVSSRAMTIAPPPNATPMEITFSINVNLFGPIVAHLKDFAGKMYCTGYLHMTTMAPNVAVLEYLDKMDQLDTEFAMSIKTRFPEAIKRDFDERRENNSFGWFRSDTDGSPHVTSLVLQNFQRAAQYVDMDATLIEQSLTYLASLQMENGEIRKENQPYKYLFEKGSCVGLTSFVLLAFLMNKNVQQKYKTFIDKGFSYVIANIEAVQCVYDLAIAFYAMQLYRHSYAVKLKDRLLNLALRDPENDHMWWPYSSLPNPDPSYYTAVSEREVTSYIALGLLETESIETILPILKWMLPLKDLRSESMDCGLALEVILKAAVKADAAHGIIDVAFTAFNKEKEYSGIVNLTPKNSSRIQMHVLPKSTNKIEFSTKDKGTFCGYIWYRFLED